ncbi:iron complex outermembrane receptor protein [Luteibacter rhizovicinus]|uniref:Iron complex outermembrane receptor protein n=1 Tax=Luteibacter rhizovicinus TaxID=242606 RepID=A0A4R3YRH5_9GAMM|nr:TonB-dependent receptor [Luteibacter rhizovicinus]TCV94976.1 iron complex outermembrane receptor protein [Luteibacter rhizovicinus]
MQSGTSQTRHRAFRRAALAAALGTCLASAALHAQDAGSTGTSRSQTLDAITVTGSRIRGTDVETAQPVVFMDREAIRASGLTQVDDILALIPSIGTADITPQDNLTSGGDTGGRYTDLRNLGSQRTLVLVNGRRWSSSLSGLTDLSTLPVSIIERIDVLKDGASSIYGSDAIGGVVNIITRDRFEGAEANVYYGVNGKGDGAQKNGDFTWGRSTENASIILGASYQDNDPMMASKRSLTSYPNGPRHPGDGLGLGAYGGVVDPRADGTAGAGSFAPDGTWVPNNYVVNHPGGVVGNTADLVNYHPYDANSNADKYNTQRDTTFRSGSKLRNLFATGRYNVSDSVALRGMVSYSMRDSTTQVAGYPLQSASGRGDGLVIDPNNAYNPFPGYATPFFRRTVEMPRVTWSKSKLAHIDFGAEGTVGIAGRDWTWDATYNYSETKSRQVANGNIYLPNAEKALGPTTVIGGQVVCANAADRAAGCVPWNILAGPGGTPQAVWNYIGATGTTRQTSRTNDITANITGGIVDLPWLAGTNGGGTVNIAGGIEHRKETGTYRPDGNDAAGLTTNLASAPTDGSYTVNEAYLELDVPLLRDLPFAQELAVNVATRYSRYSNFGSTTNNKYSFRWKPFDDLLLRGTFAQGFRAPTINDLYAGTAESFETFLDPCDSAFGASVTNADVKARCATAGVPANYRQVDLSGKQISSNTGGQSPIPFLAGSNRNLRPETSITRTAGLVYSPSYVSGMDITLDYYKVDVANIISTVLASDILNYCYLQNDPTFCGRFTRGPDGRITALNESLANLGRLRTDGYDLGLHYRLPETSIGSFRVSSDSSYLSSYERSSGPGIASHNLVGYMDGTQGLYRVRSNLRLDWDYRQFGASWTLRYYSGLKDACYTSDVECNRPNEKNERTGGLGVSQKGSIAFNDAQLRYRARWNGNFTIGVNNIFNRKGPLYYSVTATGSGSPPYNPAFDIDRYFYVGYDQKF